MQRHLDEASSIIYKVQYCLLGRCRHRVKLEMSFGELPRLVEQNHQRINWKCRKINRIAQISFNIECRQLWERLIRNAYS